MRTIRPSAKDRIGAAAITAALVLALGYALIAGLGVRLPPMAPENPLAAFNIILPPPVVVPDPPPARAPKPEGAAAPPNIKSTPTEIVAPPPIVPIVPPPIVTAPLAGMGADASAGAAPVRGPGTGSGGIGNGTGSGGNGDGLGGGGGGIPPRQIGGRISKADYPHDLFAAHVQGTVSVLYVVSPTGDVTDCEITRSSGNDQLDDMTCALIVDRFRFAPSRDARGRPVESMIEENHTWAID